MPELGRARALVWVALGALALRPLNVPGSGGPVAPLRAAAGCVLAPAGSAAPCPCEEWGAELRYLLGLPLPLNGAGAAELETLPGIGPARAAAIVRDRERHGPFAAPAELVRVPGIGPKTAARLAPELFTAGPDPACSAAPLLNPG